METIGELTQRLDETIAVYHALQGLLDPSGQQLLLRLDWLHSAAVVVESDRVLAIAARQCAEIEELDLFRRIFAAALFDDVEPGAAERFLTRAIHGERA